MWEGYRRHTGPELHTGGMRGSKLDRRCTAPGSQQFIISYSTILSVFLLASAVMGPCTSNSTVDNNKFAHVWRHGMPLHLVRSPASHPVSHAPGGRRLPRAHPLSIPPFFAARQAAGDRLDGFAQLIAQAPPQREALSTWQLTCMRSLLRSSEPRSSTPLTMPLSAADGSSIETMG